MVLLEKLDACHSSHLSFPLFRLSYTSRDATEGILSISLSSNNSSLLAKEGVSVLRSKVSHF